MGAIKIPKSQIKIDIRNAINNFLFPYDQCAHQGSAHLHRNLECRSQEGPVTHKTLVTP